MEALELFSILARGEDSAHQFKKNITNPDSLAAEFVAFSNGAGGRIFIGVDDDGSVAGLTSADIRRLNQLVSNTASQCVEPAINPTTSNVETGRGLVMVVEIAGGVAKPYQDKNGAFWVKNGYDKRKATSRKEIQRIFQKANLLHADEIPVHGLSVADIDYDYFKVFFRKRFNKSLEEQEIPLTRILENLNLQKDGVLNVGGAVLFAQAPQYKLPAFVVKAAAFNGISVADDEYLDNSVIAGKLEYIFDATMKFILSNLHHVQGGQHVNSPGISEIPRPAIEELIANALVHRDYFISAPVLVFIFRDRVEIISPGHLPNNLTVENIKSGISNIRNPVIASIAFEGHLIPYQGIGSGILRALSKYPDIDFIDDRKGNTFKVVIKRRDHQ
ncbi:MAG: putative DNA binding domain-containing protein [Deltaproteobacteria bacterium]|jgi:ATP-dependent DNA helicase RecG|nr:putative DNA binding domain-containing protein [Deltaproteobacteria bacterium]